jgi:hypothetical protein
VICPPIKALSKTAVLESTAGGIDSGTQSGWTGTDDDDIVTHYVPHCWIIYSISDLSFWTRELVKRNVEILKKRLAIKVAFTIHEHIFI